MNSTEQMEALASAERRQLLLALRNEAPDDGILERFEKNADDSVDTDFQLAMRHLHLPKLDEYGIVDWDRESDTVQQGPEFEGIEPLLDTLSPQRERLTGVDEL